jgi:hypothetical protein
MAVSTVPSAHAAIAGTVQGGGQGSDLTVVALRTRALRADHAVADIGAVDPQTGAFTIHHPAASNTLMVTSGCPAEALRRGDLLGCQRFVPDLRWIPDNTTDLRLQIPDLEEAAAIWAGQPASGGPGPWLGVGLIALLLLAAAGLVRIKTPRIKTPRIKATSATAPIDRPRIDPRLVVGLSLASLIVLLPGLGSEPLDLLEYSYFHEGVRPDSAAQVLHGSISAELAHGPVQPLILRGMAAISTSPWALRLPSVLFGILFVLCAAVVARQHLSSLASMATGIVALTSPVAFYYARDATPYTLAGLCAAASLVLLGRASHTRRPNRLWAGVAGLQVLGFFSHYGYAFVSLALLLGLIGAWRRQPALLSRALVAFAAAAALPTLVAGPLWTMFRSSGIRFALMSPAYPDTPGLLAFGADFLTVLTGLPHDAALLLGLTLPLVALGLHTLLRRAPLLGWVCLAQVALLLLFLVFSHTMSTSIGGGRVFYAYRWTRPLLLGLLLPLGALVLTRARWAVLILVLAASVQLVGMYQGARPDFESVRAMLAAQAQPGDAYAVLPAPFYGDLVQYHLADGNPPDLITSMRTVDLRVGDHMLRGPLVELDLPLATVADRLQYRRVWVINVREKMFGTAKFREIPAWLPGWTEVSSQGFPFVDVTLLQCDADCAWQGQQRLVIDPQRPLQANRYVVSAPGFGEPLPTDDITIALPPDARSVQVLEAGQPNPSRVLSLTPTRAHLNLADARGPLLIELTR